MICFLVIALTVCSSVACIDPYYFACPPGVTEFQGACYQLHPHLNFKEAYEFCYSRQGFLITEHIIPLLNAGQVPSSIGLNITSCYWLLHDVQEKDLVHPDFHTLPLKAVMCRALCGSREGWRLYRYQCEHDLPYVCYFTKTFYWKKITRKKRSKRKDKRTVVSKISSSLFLSGVPVFEQRVPTVTMCSRLCRDKCDYLNYNGLTQMCRGHKTISGSENPVRETKAHWQLWEFTEV